ncbi:hypothetical protein ACWPXT_07565 [Enterococcus faecium]
MMYQNKLTGNIEQIRNKVDFLNKQAFDQFGYTEKIDGRDIGARIKLDIEDLNKAMEVNGINTNLYIRFKESTNSFKEKSVSQLIKIYKKQSKIRKTKLIMVSFFILPSTARGVKN